MTLPAGIDPGGFPAMLAGLGLTFVLHATVLMLAVWGAERLGWLKEPAWAEWAWRLALFGAFASVALGVLPRRAPDTPLPVRTEAIETTPQIPVASVPTVARGDATPTAAAVPEAAQHASTAGSPLPKAMRTPSSSMAAFALRLPEALVFALLVAWSIGSATMFLRVLRQSRAVLRLRARSVREGIEASPALRDELRSLASDMRVRLPGLRLLPGLPGPLVLPGEILLPCWVEEIDPRRRRAMLAHELAHLRRRDPLWRPLQRMACVPLFFHPLAWMAVRRLETLAETLCDRIAAERSGGGRPLAECLAECLARGAATAHPSRGAGWALAMAERDGDIVSRVKDLLENPHMKMSSIPARWRWTAAGAALLALVAMPGVMVIARPGALPEMFGNHDLSVSIRRDGDTYTVRSGLPGSRQRFHLRMDGDVAFTPREDDVARMAPDAKFTLLQQRDGKTRELKIVPSASGLNRHYRLDGVAHPFDADAKAWLATAIPEIHRLTGIDADARIRRMVAQDGVSRVLDEIDLLRTDHVRAEYIAKLSGIVALDDTDMTAVIAATARIDSDYEKRRAMGALLGQARIASTNQGALLAVATGIDSDFERSEWLIAATGALPVDGANGARWQDALLGMDSDFERRRALQAMIENGKPRTAAVALALRSMRGMDSDFESRSVLETAAKSRALRVDADYFAVVDAMGSDFERREALVALVRAAAPGVARSRGVLNSVRALDSDFERGEVLKALAGAMPDDPALIDDYRAVARAMGSQHERGKAERALDRFHRG